MVPNIPAEIAAATSAIAGGCKLATFNVGFCFNIYRVSYLLFGGGREEEKKWGKERKSFPNVVPVLVMQND